MFYFFFFCCCVKKDFKAFVRKVAHYFTHHDVMTITHLCIFH